MMNILLIDGNHILRPIWDASQQDVISNREDYFNLVLGSIKRAIKEHQPSHVLIAFDSYNDSWRKEFDSDYKLGKWSLPKSYRVKLSSFRKKLSKKEKELYLQLAEEAGIDTKKGGLFW